MDKIKRCLVCGNSDYEVERMHQFPRNLEQSKKWQESLGMKYMPGISLNSYYICTNHFTADSYYNNVTGRLFRHAIPTLNPAVNGSNAENLNNTTEDTANVPDSDCSQTCPSVLEEVSNNTTDLPRPPIASQPQTRVDMIPGVPRQVCSMPYCDGKDPDGCKVATVYFPRDPALKQKWLEYLYPKPLPIEPYSRVCLRHFEPGDVEWVTSCTVVEDKLVPSSKFPRIVKGAVPIPYLCVHLQQNGAHPQQLDIPINNADSTCQLLSYVIVNEDYFIDLEDAYQKLERAELDPCWFKIKESRYIYLFYLDPDPKPSLKFAVHFADDLTLSLKLDDMFVGELQCRNQTKIQFPVKVQDLKTFSVIFKEIEFYLKNVAQFKNVTNGNSDSTSSQTKFQERHVKITDNVCKSCLKDVDVYVRCVKCQNEFHPGCLAVKGLDDCDKCRETFSRLSEQRASSRNDTSGAADSEYMVIKVEEEDNLFEESYNLMEEKINSLTFSSVK
ncbi:uncharacterized protein LOC115888843 isoform X3 [Sitophilus oryzae]|uniref:Uncharacterized protein LOC115888843 isoform X3 n=1 Tax=Sitophilus oryzae TaxID=7048 RepID=A0A6J2YMD9_SITOR|nr:uncharacterized protein LOC115888843 isoform X3 [Sitophilus oryzae]